MIALMFKRQLKTRIQLINIKRGQVMIETVLIIFMFETFTFDANQKESGISTKFIWNVAGKETVLSNSNRIESKCVI